MNRILGLLACLLLGFVTSTAADGLENPSYDYSDPEFLATVNMLDMEGHSTDDLSSCNVKQMYYREVGEMFSKGMTKDEILEYYLKEQGVHALLAPPGKGFNLTLWVTPFLLIILMGVLIYFVVKKWTKNNTVLAQGDVVNDVDEIEYHIYKSIIEEERKKLI